MTPAQTNAKQQALGFVEKLNDVILTPLILFLLGVALLVFMYGAFEYLMNANNEQGRETGRRHLVWGLVGLVIMVSALAILRIAVATFGLDGDLDNFMKK